jgi:hypothetical protein
MIQFPELGRKGRLGNQLFQIAATMGIASEFKQDWRIPADWVHRDRFQIPSDKFSLQRIDNTYSDEEAFHYRPVPYANNLNLSGYFQSYRYWESIMPIVKETLTPKVHSVRSDSVALHVRRGDYLTHEGCYEELNINYYREAMALFEGADFLIFSDDIPFCREMFKSMKVEFSTNVDAVDDLSRMVGCSGVIMANSSFSWWGGMLNSGKIVAPKRWFGPSLQTLDTKDLRHPTWTVL